MDGFLSIGHSRRGEEGIIREVMRRIGIESGWFVDVGAGDGVHASNTFALAHRGWCGLSIEAGASEYEKLVGNMAPYPQVLPHHGYVSCEPGERVDEIMERYGVPPSCAVVSIDVDGNDYWIWRDLKARPRLVVIEYNSHFDPTDGRVIRYDPRHRWRGDDYYGASAKAMVDLGESLGYGLVYATVPDNLFFVLKEQAHLFASYPLERLRRVPLYRPSAKAMIAPPAPLRSHL